MPANSSGGTRQAGNFLEKILHHKKQEIQHKKKTISLLYLKNKTMNAPPVIPFKNIFKKFALIGEIKPKSPSAGVLKKSFQLEQLAKIYQKNGVSAVSVLTDKKFFNGSLSNLSRVKEVVSVPVLAKDFFIDPYQVYEARVAGADAILLIVRILSDKKLKELFALSKKLGMDCLVEVHSKQELDRALKLGADIIGVNNRDLDTFHVDLGVSLALVRFIPEKVCAVAESGISTRKHVLMLKKAGYDSILAGEALMRSRNPGRMIRKLIHHR